MTAIYTEFVPILLGLLAINFAAVVLVSPKRSRVACVYLLILLAPGIVNPGATISSARVFKEVLAYKGDEWPAKDLAWFWAGRGVWYDAEPATMRLVVMAYAATITIVGLTGLLRWLVSVVATGVRNWRRYSVTTGLAASVAALGLLPLLAMIRGHHGNGYMFIKLLITSMPLQALGMALLVSPLWPTNGKRWSSRRGIGILPNGSRRKAVAMGRGGAFAYLLLGACFAICVNGTVQRIYASTTIEPENYDYWNRGYHLLAPETRQLQDQLSALHDEDILFALVDRERGTSALLNCWAGYFARDNRVWLSRPYFKEDFLPDAMQGKRIMGIPLPLPPIKGMDSLLDLSDLPWDALVLSCQAHGYLALPPNSAHVVWSNHRYSLWRPSSKYWAFPLGFVEQPRIEMEHAPCFSIGPRSIYLDFVAGSRGTLVIEAEIERGGDFPGISECRLLVGVDNGPVTNVLAQGRNKQVCVSVAAGKSSLCFQVAQPDAADSDKGVSAETEYLRVKNLRLNLKSP